MEEKRMWARKSRADGWRKIEKDLAVLGGGGRRCKVVKLLIW